LAREDPLRPRKRPRQRRSRETVNVILDGAARVFAERGYAGGTTNRIARAAGVSVGSLYEYFPNKDAVLVALAERHLQEMMFEVESHLVQAGRRSQSLDALLHRFVDAMLAVHERAPELHGLFFSEAPHPPGLHACVLQMEETLAHSVEAILRRSSELTLRDPDTAAHLVVQTVEALTHRFVHHGLHDLGREAFLDEVVALLQGYLRS
jgi:AcrR family transcriptional regulator